jgi:hypothetical protein
MHIGRETIEKGTVETRRKLLCEKISLSTINYRNHIFQIFSLRKFTRFPEVAHFKLFSTLLEVDLFPQSCTFNESYAESIFHQVKNM